MGSVYRARSEDAVGEVALKTVDIPSRSVLSTLRREIRMLERVDHPNVVGVVDHGSDDGTPWYAMELVDGPTLHDVLQDAPDHEDLCGILANVCRGLAHLHSAGIVHRDLKPGNIIVSNGTPIIVDFGLASTSRGGLGREKFDVLSDSTGTPNYMAPEQVGGKWADARADLYSLGCMLYQGIYGQAPFDGNPPFLTMLMHANEEPEYPDTDAPAAMLKLTKLLLQKDPADRPAYADDVADRLDALSDNTTTYNRRSRPYLYRPRLVERDEQLRQIRDHVTESSKHKGGVVSVVGEKGLGKTRLLIEATSNLAQTNVVNGAISEIGSEFINGAHSVLTALLDACQSEGISFERMVIKGDGKVLGQIHEGFANLASSRDAHDLHESRPGDTLRGSFAAFADVLERWSEKAPIVVVFDDFESLDEWTKSWVRWVVRGGRYDASRVLVIVSSLESIDGVEAVECDQLGPEAMADMLTSMFASDRVPQRLAHLVQTKCEGNPLVVTELVRNMVDENVLVRNEVGTWAVQDSPLVSFSSVAASSTLASLHRARLNELGPGPKEIAQLLRVLNDAADVGWFEHRVDDVDALIDEGLAIVSPRGIELVNMDVIPEPSGAELSKSHALIASFIPDETQYEELKAKHLELAGNTRRAQVLYLNAARAHAKALRFRASIDAFVKARELSEGLEAASISLEAAEVAIRGELNELAEDLALKSTQFPGIRPWLTVGKARGATGRFDESIDALHSAKARAMVPEELAEVESELGVTYCRAGNTKEGRVHLDSAYAFLSKQPPSEIQLRTLMVIGVAEHLERDYEAAKATFERALEGAQKHGVLTVELYCRQNLAVLLGDLGMYDEAMDQLKALLEIVRQKGLRGTEAITLSNLGLIMSKAGLYQSAEVTLDLAIEAHRRIGGTIQVATGQVYLADVLSKRGAMSRALTLASTGCKTLKDAGARRNFGFAMLTLAEIQRRDGQIVEARKSIESADKLKLKDSFYRSLSLSGRLRLEIVEGKTPAADAAQILRKFTTAVGLEDALKLEVEDLATMKGPLEESPQ